MHSIAENKETDCEVGLNSRNKQMLHLTRIRQIHQKQKELKRYQNISIEKASKQFLEDLLSITDPFVNKKHRDFLKLDNKSQGTPFLQRMLADTKFRSACKDVLVRDSNISRMR